MKINRITLENFGSYEGEATFETREQNSRNIILIGGKNGAGKTTLFTAMRLCLYGFMSMGYKSHNAYYSRAITKLINNIMYDGKKGVAQKIVYDAFAVVEEKSGKNPLEAFQAALDNIMPKLEVKARRVGGSTYQVPMDVRPERQLTLGLRWITRYSRERNERTMADRLAAEILDAMNNTGASVKKKEDTHKMAEANKAFAHFRW